MRWITVFVLMVGGVAMGQTTRPSAPVSLDGLPKDVREEILSLRREVSILRAEVKSLKAVQFRQKPIANAKAAILKINDPKIAAAVDEGRLAIGMTLEEAEAALHKHSYYSSYSIKRETGDRQLYEFSFMAEFRDGQLIPLEDSQFAWFQDGKIVDWRK